MLWLARETGKISPKAARGLAEARSSGEGLAVASATLWEVAQLSAKGKIKLDPPVEVFLEKVQSTYHVLPLDRRIAVRGTQFSPAYPSDPADRQIGATAIVHGLVLVTGDAKILDCGEVSCLW